MRLKALATLALLLAFSAPELAQARAHSPTRSKVVSLTTGDSTTYVSTRRAKKSRKHGSSKSKHAKAKKHASHSKKSKRHPASSTKTKSKHRAKGKKAKHKRH